MRGSKFKVDNIWNIALCTLNLLLNLVPGLEEMRYLFGRSVEARRNFKNLLKLVVTLVAC